MSFSFERVWSWSGSEFVPGGSVPVSDRAFRYGMSLLESLRLANGKPQHLEAHLARLQQACHERQFPCSEAILSAAGNLLKNHPGEGFARIYVTAGDGAPTAPVEQCRVFVFVEARERPVLDEYRVALQGEICHPLFGGIKTGNYWMNLDRLQRAQAEGFQEALLFNERAELISSCVANVFVVHGEVIRTPAPECGARAGVIRERLFQCAPVQECSLFVQDILSADEIFLTNSWIGVMPVGSVDGKRLPSQAIARRLAPLV